MHRSGFSTPKRLGSHRPPRQRVSIIGDLGVDEPTDRGTEKFDLVDRLRRPDTSQLGWPISRTDDHRHIREAGLDNRRQEVCGSGATRADRHSGCAGETSAEGDESCGPLVEHDLDRQSSVGDRCQRKRGAARPGRHDHLADATGDPLVEECGTERRSGRHDA